MARLRVARQIAGHGRPLWPTAWICGGLPLSERKARLAAIGKGAESWIALANGFVGEGRALYRAVVAADLEGTVAKRLARRLPAEAGAVAQDPEQGLFAVSRPSGFASAVLALSRNG